MRELVKQGPGGNVVQAVGIARAMVPRWECGWHILATPRTQAWLEGNNQGGEISMKSEK